MWIGLIMSCALVCMPGEQKYFIILYPLIDIFRYTALTAADHWSDTPTRPPYWEGQAAPPIAFMSIMAGGLSTIQIIISR